MAGIIGDIAILAIGADCHTTVARQRLEIRHIVDSLAIKAIASTILAR